MRIAKYIAHSGYCSRRKAEELISNNKVKINSVICNNPATKILYTDSVSVNQKKIYLNDKIRIWVFYKPTGIITTSKDPRGRKTIYDILPKFIPRVISVGRLDINSEGLLLLTNNGDLARYLELPKNKLIRVYRVKIRGKIKKDEILNLSKGIKIDNFRYKPIKARLEKQMFSNAWIRMDLIEGKNREIRKICSHLGLRVIKLIRIKFGKFNIGTLKSGQIKEIKNHSYNDNNYWR
tara:strand:+ start:237 stop:944 length:708 start_codon:yes stop_codon:yes gene_type:complete